MHAWGALNALIVQRAGGTTSPVAFQQVGHTLLMQLSRPSSRTGKSIIHNERMKAVQQKCMASDGSAVHDTAAPDMIQRRWACHAAWLIMQGGGAHLWPGRRRSRW